MSDLAAIGAMLICLILGMLWGYVIGGAWERRSERRRRFRRGDWSSAPWIGTAGQMGKYRE